MLFLLYTMAKLMRFFPLRYLRHSVSKMSSSGCFILQLKNPSAVFQDTKLIIAMQRTQYYLGKKEQVDEGVYSPLEVKVETKEGPLLCRTYKMNNFRPCLPSAQYKKVVCLEAQQNSLPQNYIQKLLALKTNNYNK
uniref:Gamma-glutamylcyclotransferase n=1 Tax=Cyprinus carpio TaxID=7962 RepID=A0A8C1M916_CYPCA